MIKKLKSLINKTNYNRIVNPTAELKPSKMIIGGNTIRKGENTYKAYIELSKDDLLKKDVVEQSRLLMKISSIVDKALDDLVSLSVTGFSYTPESDAGKAVIDELVETAYPSFEYILRKVFTSIMLRGEYCIETTLGDIGLWCVDPKEMSYKRGDDGEWELGQYQEGEFVKIDSPTVIMEPVNIADLEESSGPRGKSMIASAFPAIIEDMFMKQNLGKAIENQAWTFRYIVASREALLKATPHATASQINEAMATIMNDISGWAKLGPDVLPKVSGEVEVKTAQGSANDITFVDPLGKQYERDAARGVKTVPAYIGLSEFQAETSMRTLALQYLRKVNSYQQTVEFSLEKIFTQHLRNAGIAGAANVQLQKVNDEQRKLEAEMFDSFAKGVKTLTESGMSLDEAIKLYTQQTGEQIIRENSNEN